MVLQRSAPFAPRCLLMGEVTPLMTSVNGLLTAKPPQMFTAKIASQWATVNGRKQLEIKVC
jgi:hypothetical protein